MRARFPGWLLSVALAVLASGCRTGDRRGRDALDQLKTDRIGVAVVLAQHPGLERVLHAEFARPVNGMKLEWSGAPPSGGGAAEHEWDGPRRRLLLRASPDFSPEDQLLAVFFEIAGARSLPLFLALEREVVAGRIDREAFPDELVRIEHGSVVAAKSVFPALLPIPPADLDRHRLYADLLRAPDDFDAFLEWRKSEFAGAYARNREEALRRYDGLVGAGAGRDPAAGGR